MALNTPALLVALRDHAGKLGVFDRVAGHEPRNAPGRGVTCAYMLRKILPFPAQSGLDATSVVVTVVARLYKPAPGDADDTETVLAWAADALIGALSGDFTLDGIACDVDLLGRTGTALGAEFGWLRQDDATLRTCDITIPVVINDVWEQAS